MNTRIEPTEQQPEPLPQSGGSWARDADGGLRPLDEATAIGAGLDWPAASVDPMDPRGARRARAATAATATATPADQE
ncbi:MAG: hypothetical protein RLY71_427 [Pseudomonadota bacterium]|jgi:hypothetical protein